MITGKYLYDSNIFLDFASKEASIQYGYPVSDNKSFIPEQIYLFLYPFFTFFWLSFYLIHYFLILPHISRLKHFPALSYLNSMNSLYRFLFGDKTMLYEGSHDSNQIVVHSKNNFEFSYTLTEDYSKYCSSIELYANVLTHTWHKHEFNSYSGWFFVINFTQIPQVGTAKITYL